MAALEKNLKALCLATGVAGMEDYEASAVAAKLLGEYTNDVTIDIFGTVVGRIPTKKKGAKTLLLDAHLDEIGMVVTYIDDKGFLKFSNAGGIDKRLLSAQLVTVHCSNGKDVTGVVGSKPPHLEKSDEANKIADMDDMYIDVGMTKESAQAVICPGDIITIKSEFTKLLNGRISCKALDDRAGVAAILETLELLKGKELPVNLVVQFSAREEIGGPGAKASAYAIEPDYAIAVDVSFAATPDAKAHLCGKLGEGTMIGYHVVLDKKMTDTLVALAKEKKIAHQIEGLGGSSTGTNADGIIQTKGGIRTALLSIPQRYMHTPIEVCAISDIKATAALMAEFALNWKE